ncbi:Aste57867_4816 [Aphanomyces stellatus]|uniref:Aste57867_4816 protein n=2 Tax=Aphanomyces stellatus TaxID=120398 RepID=A0A485KGX7_9STRA|nr:hypothetical protein As57867_004803 [Aphanomyces stellatus]VFT81910.1 Aste57867_4816 [Aphanomyces stellatus]
MQPTSILSTVILASIMTVAAGHGYLVDPKATYNQVDDFTKYAGTIDGYKAMPNAGGIYDQDPRTNANNFNAAFKTSKYTSLRDLVQKNGDPGGPCGFTNPNGDAQALPGVVKWGHSANEAFTPSHEGPCEVWCDNTRVFQNDDCPANIPNGQMPIDKSKCQGAKQLYFVWAALHTSSWQIYKTCVKLQGGGGPTPPSPPSNKPSVVPSTRPSPPSPPSPPNGSVQPWGQCGGKQYKGPTSCTKGHKCDFKNDWYSQCVPY